MEHELLELAGLNGSIGGEESLELMASQSCAIAVQVALTQGSLLAPLNAKNAKYQTAS